MLAREDRTVVKVVSAIATRARPKGDRIMEQKTCQEHEAQAVKSIRIDDLSKSVAGYPIDDVPKPAGYPIDDVPKPAGYPIDDVPKPAGYPIDGEPRIP